jgi:hypothetical protein
MKSIRFLVSGSALALGLLLLLFVLMPADQVGLAAPARATTAELQVCTICTYATVQAAVDEVANPTTSPSALPDVVITDIWWGNDKVWYQIRNIGAVVALQGKHCTRLRIEGALQSIDCVDVDLAPGERATRWLSYISIWVFPREAIEVCADYNNDMQELDETNNCRTESWKRDITPPEITFGPVVSETTTSTALIFWQTDEESDSVVRYARNSGRYNLEEADATLAQDHLVTLTGLEPSTVYHYTVLSTDAARNTVASKEGFFKTTPSFDVEAPTIYSVTVTRGEGDFEHYYISASVSDNIGVAQVEFYMDDVLIGTDYAGESDGSLTTSSYEIVLAPALQGLSRDDWFDEHAWTILARDLSGLTAQQFEMHTPTLEPMDVDVEIVSPVPDYILFIDGDVVPAGTTVDIEVYAVEYEWGCVKVYSRGEGISFSCRDVAHEVATVEFYVDGALKHTVHPATDVFTPTYAWDASGLGPGTHTIDAKAIAGDGWTHEAEQHTVTIFQGVPSIDVQREVARVGNTFWVRLTVENQGDISANVDRIEDTVLGFQAVGKSDENYEVTTSYSPDSKRCDVEIDFSTGDVDSITLEPGQDFIAEYFMVPVLHSTNVEVAIGDEATVVHYEALGQLLDDAFSRPYFGDDGEWLSWMVEDALATSDYLIVTTPERLFDLYADDEVDILLSTMAHLAYLKQGVLGYLVRPDPTIDWDEWMRGDLTYLTEPGGDWAARLHDDFSTAGGGYLLIVGETEVVPSWLVAGWNLNWGNWPCNTREVDLTDLPYADTGENGAPELVVGRIVGNDAAALTRPLQASIGVYEGQDGYGFNRSDALLVSGVDGTASIQQMFTDFVSDTADILDDEFTVDTLHWSEVAANQRLTQFKNKAPDNDVICYQGHGSPDLWSLALNTADFPGNPSAVPPIPAVDFGNTTPFVFSLACLTGSYEDHTANAPCGDFDGGDYNIAEAFFDHGTGVFVGSTEVSEIGRNVEAGKDFFETWWQADTSIGEALTQLKRDRWWQDDYWDLWVTEYNLYGDPKFGAVAPSRAGDVSMPATVQTAPSSLDIEIPDYEVMTTTEGLDYVEIPGGELWLEPGGYRVPYWSISLDYPKGQRVEDVALIDRSGLVTDTGLIIPTTTVDIACIACSGVESTAVSGSDQQRDWFPDPEEVYRWTATENPDGSTTLVVIMYPFYYSPLTTDVEFYKNYSFDIQTISSTVSITRLTTDEAIYPQGGDVLIDLWLENTGDAQDVIVSTVVKAGGSGQVVDDLLLDDLSDLTGEATYALQWDSAGFEAGYYTIEAEIRDADGDVLDRATRRFRLGIVSGEVTALTATPGTFDLGDTISVTMVFSNTGTVPITGTAVIQVQDGGSEVVETFSHAVANLALADAVSFEDGWDTSGAAGGTYRILGYVLYDAKATKPKIVNVSTKVRIYLPLILKN